MKAKYFTKLRKKARWYDVEVTSGLFGNFSGFDYGIRVLALSHKNACLRACRRGYGLNHSGMYNITTEKWGHFAVKLSSSTPHWRNIGYYGN